jgi:hypothetical protein
MEVDVEALIEEQMKQPVRDYSKVQGKDSFECLDS